MSVQRAVSRAALEGIGEAISHPTVIAPELREEALGSPCSSSARRSVAAAA